MSRRAVRNLIRLTTVVLLPGLAPLAGAAPPVFPNNPIPPSFYNASPGYYGPYYPGQYQYGNVSPGVYNNYPAPSYSGYGTSSGIPVPYSAQLYGSSAAPGLAPSAYAPPAASDRYRVPLYAPSPSRAVIRQDTPAQADVFLPTPDAELWVEGQPTRSTGAWRRFRSPPLIPGERYVYEFRTRWVDNGREIVRSREVPVQAGRWVTVDFTRSPERGAAAGDVRSLP